jgi:hypothetical protein
MVTTTQNPKSKIQNPSFVLRPRDVGGLLDLAVVLYRRNFSTYVGIVALMQVPVSLVLTLANIVLLDPDSLRQTPARPPPGASPDAIASYQAGTVAAVSDLLSRGLLILALAVLGGILLNIATGALAHAITAAYLGRPLSLRDAYRAVRRQVPALTGLILLMILSTVLLIVPPLFAWVFISWSFATQAVVLERQGVTGALARSWSLVSGSWWRVFGAYLLLLLIDVILGLAPSVLSPLLAFTGASWAVETIVVQFAGLLVTVLYVPIRLAGMTLLYFDLRVRKEGLDLQMALDRQAADLGLEPVPPGLAGAWPYRAAAPAPASEASPSAYREVVRS